MQAPRIILSGHALPSANRLVNDLSLRSRRLGRPSPDQGGWKTPKQRFWFCRCVGLDFRKHALGRKPPHLLHRLPKRRDGGVLSHAGGTSSKPTIEQSSGTRLPAVCNARIAPSAVRSSNATRALNGPPARSKSWVRASPPSKPELGSTAPGSCLTSFGEMRRLYSRANRRHPSQRRRLSLSASGPRITAISGGPAHRGAAAPDSRPAHYRR